LTRLFLLRHAESEWNAEGRWQGQADPDLSDRGRVEARAAASRLVGEIGRIVSSDQRRAAQTADIIADVLGLAPVEHDPALREIDVGEWSGLTTPEIDERWPGAIERWRRGEDPGNGGEDRSSFKLRILAAVRAHAGRGTGPLLIVTHGAAIGVIERHLGIHPGVPVPRLAGRWFEFDGEVRAVTDRIELAEEL
jgi:probable phosphoglycerate mutase